VRFHRYYFEHIIPPPIEEFHKKWSDDEMMAFIREFTLPQIRRFLMRFPAGALLIIGQTKDVKQRNADYNSYAVVYRHSDVQPFIEYNDMITFRCWTRYEALRFEYLLLYHTLDPEGEFYSEFQEHVNKQSYNIPTQTEENSEPTRPHFVYLKATKKNWTWADATDFFHEELKPEGEIDNSPIKPPKLKRAKVSAFESDDEE
jgi:hypothetical protein